MEKILDIEVELLHETPAAYRVASCTTGKVAWVPKSQCELDGESLQLPAWLAEEKGLV